MKLIEVLLAQLTLEDFRLNPRGDSGPERQALTSREFGSFVTTGSIGI
ncbi:hypothetical protein BH18GEM1_BH18GEM1_03950 [soil metagenome]